MNPAPSRKIALLAFTLGLVIALSCMSTVSALPEPTGYMVNDWVYVLTSSEEDDLENLCRWIEEQTTVEIYVIITDDLTGEDLDRYSYLVFNDWGIGKEDVNNGLLLTIYYWENTTHFSYEFRIEVGRGLEGAITDSEAGRIARDNCTPWFDLWYFAYGLEDGIWELYDEFKDDLSVVSTEGNRVGLAAFRYWGYQNPLIAGAIVAIGFIFLSMWFRIALRFRGGALIPIVGIVALLLFAWWWDDTLYVLGYSIILALGGTVILTGGSRVRGGGGRTEGGGFRY